MTAKVSVLHIRTAKPAIRICRYIDDFHTEVGDTIYHICEFAERMEKIGAAVAPLNRQNQNVRRNGNEENL